jgi:hypothetical protein
MCGFLAGVIGCTKKLPCVISALFLMLAILLSIPVHAESPNLTVSGDDRAPERIYTGNPHSDGLNNIVMLEISISTNYSAGVTVTNITLQRTGSAADESVQIIMLYRDDNTNGQLDTSSDTLLGSGSFFQSKVEFSAMETVTCDNPLKLLVALNLSGETPSDTTLGVEIPDKSYIETQEAAEIEFEFCVCSKNSTVLLDSDGDLNPDSTDPDDDNDGYMDDVEQSSGSDPLDAESVPEDTDGDFVPDAIDTDDDDDGVPDKYDDFPKDPDRQRDYTMVIIYAIIAVIVIIVLVLVTRVRKPKGPVEEDIDEDEFDLDSIEDEIEEEDDIDLIEDEEESE